MHVLRIDYTRTYVRTYVRICVMYTLRSNNCTLGLKSQFAIIRLSSVELSEFSLYLYIYLFIYVFQVVRRARAVNAQTLDRPVEVQWSI